MAAHQQRVLLWPLYGKNNDDVEDAIANNYRELAQSILNRADVSPPAVTAGGIFMLHHLSCYTGA